MGLPYEAVIFDLDGVLCSTDHYHYLAWKQLADRLHIFFDETVNQQLRGISRMESLDILLGNGTIPYSEAEKRQFAEEKNALYVKSLAGLTPNDLAPHALDTLNALSTAGLRLAVGSSSCNAPLILHRLGLDDFFDAVADGTQITHSKPDPEVFLLAARLLNKAPSACLVVEDAAAGIRAAKAAGMGAAAIGDAQDNVQADYHLKSLSSLLCVFAL